MFMQSTASRIFLKRSTTQPIVQQPRRFFQKFGKGGYNSGFERMVVDKFAWSGIQSYGALAFISWGLANIGIYGLSLVMYKENWNYYFAYTGDGKFLQPFKSMMASDSLSNVIWTAPSLIGGGLVLNSKVGSLSTFKLFCICLFGSYLATCSLGPATHASHLNIRGLMPMRFDCIDEKRSRMVGADLMAGACLYACLFAHGYWLPGLAFAAFDLSYYGPMGLSMPVTAGVAALAMF